MKLRIRDNSLRLRLTRSEVANLQNLNPVEASIQFGPNPENRLIYRIETSSTEASLQARFEEKVIRVILPQGVAERWTQGSDVGVYAHQSLGGDQVLKILIEKDFFCLKPRSHEQENESDMYPHPHADRGTC